MKKPGYVKVADILAQNEMLDRDESRIEAARNALRETMMLVGRADGTRGEGGLYISIIMVRGDNGQTEPMVQVCGNTSSYLTLDQARELGRVLVEL